MPDMSTGTIEQLFGMRHIEQSCPYLPSQTTCSLYLDGNLIGMGYRALLDQGYRRAGSLLYRPDCPSCSECQILRVPVQSFRRSKSQRRIWNRGRRLFSYDVGEPMFTDERLKMYRDYMREIHGDEDEPSAVEFESAILTTSLREATREIRIWDGPKLAGIGIVDFLTGALSTVYFYYDPKYAPYRLGTFSVLAELDIAKGLGLQFYYLGYYIEDCASMNYKNQFRPCELKRIPENEWRTLS